MNYFAFSLSDILKFDPAVANNMTMAEKLENLLTTAVVGFALVFTVLALIWLVLTLFTAIIGKKTDEVNKETANEPSPEPVAAPVPAPEPVTVSDDAEIIAAISAAISAYTGMSQKGFRVVSFRRK